MHPELSIWEDSGMLNHALSWFWNSITRCFFGSQYLLKYAFYLKIRRIYREIDGAKSCHNGDRVMLLRPDNKWYPFVLNWESFWKDFLLPVNIVEDRNLEWQRWEIGEVFLGKSVFYHNRVRSLPCNYQENDVCHATEDYMLVLRLK